MPNWVFNSITGFTPELHEKYKSEDFEIDFNKVIPEPEEINNTISGSYAKVAKEIYEYKKIKENRGESCSSEYIRSNPLHDNLQRDARYTLETLGELALKNPNESLRSLLSKEENKYKKRLYDDHVKVLGNRTFNEIPSEELKQVFDNYCDLQEEKYQEWLNSDHYHKGEFEYPESLDVMGKQLVANKEKYGFDNWYDWRVANWGTKWNACDSEYDEETQTVRFNTAWSIPYQIISKIAKDNPQVKLEGYSEEETGWFDEYHTEAGKVHVTCHGETEWVDDEGEETKETREEVDEIISYDEYAEQERKQWESFTNSLRNRI